MSPAHKTPTNAPAINLGRETGMAIPPDSVIVHTPGVPESTPATRPRERRRCRRKTRATPSTTRDSRSEKARGPCRGRAARAGLGSTRRRPRPSDRPQKRRPARVPDRRTPTHRREHPPPAPPRTQGGSGMGASASPARKLSVGVRPGKQTADHTPEPARLLHQRLPPVGSTGGVEDELSCDPVVDATPPADPGGQVAQAAGVRCQRAEEPFDRPPLLHQQRTPEHRPSASNISLLRSRAGLGRRVLSMLGGALRRGARNWMPRSSAASESLLES